MQKSIALVLCLLTLQSASDDKITFREWEIINDTQGVSHLKAFDAGAKLLRDEPELPNLLGDVVRMCAITHFALGVLDEARVSKNSQISKSWQIRFNQLPEPTGDDFHSYLWHAVAVTCVVKSRLIHADNGKLAFDFDSHLQLIVSAELNSKKALAMLPADLNRGSIKDVKYYADGIAKTGTLFRKIASQHQKRQIAKPSNGNTELVGIRFRNAAFQSVRVFNVDANGREVRSANSSSPGDCALASGSTNHDDFYSSMLVNVFARNGEVAGTYGFEANLIEVKDRHLLKPNDVVRQPKIAGTFIIPAGKEEVWLTWDTYSKKFNAKASP